MPHDENTPEHEFLTWTDNRWHCDGIGIHAGTFMEMRVPAQHNHKSYGWVDVRIESTHGGQRLIAYREEHGIMWASPVRYSFELRWPT